MATFRGWPDSRRDPAPMQGMAGWPEVGNQAGWANIARRLNRRHPINSGLVGWWPMDEGRGTRVRDLSTYGNHGTITNAADPATASSGWGAGASQRDLAFDEVNDYVNVPHGAHLAILGDVSISFWFRFRSNPTGYPAIQKGGSFPQPYGISSQPSRSWNFTRGNGASQTYILGVTATPVDVWGHAVGTYSPGVYSVYINGVLDASGAGTGPGSVSDTGTALGIGANFPTTTNQWMTGSMRHVRIYNRALNAAEVKQLYADPWIGAF